MLFEWESFDAVRDVRLGRIDVGDPTRNAAFRTAEEVRDENRDNNHPSWAPRARQLSPG